MWNGEYHEALCSRGEDELDKYEIHRIKGFTHFDNKHTSSLLLAKLGTKCEDRDSVKCVFCNKVTSLNNEAWSYYMEETLKINLHKPGCSWAEYNIPLKDEIAAEGYQRLKELTRSDCIGISEDETNRILRNSNVRMCPCNTCKATFLKDNLLMSKSPPFRVNTVTNTMNGHLRDLLRRQEEAKLIEILYQRNRNDEYFIETDVPGHLVCVSCGIEYWGQEEEDERLVWHAQNAPYCPLVKKKHGAAFIHEQLMKLKGDVNRPESTGASEMKVGDVEVVMNMCSEDPSNLDPKSAKDIVKAYTAFFLQNGSFPADGGRTIVRKLEEYA